jgi:DNA-binding GntR family transcriptional regulator
VSRTPVREAFRMLQAEGIVRVEPNRGARVRSLSVEDISDVYELRARLEAMASELAAQRATVEERARLGEAEARFATAVTAAGERGADGASVRSVFEANAAFHGAILEAAHSERLAQALATTSDDGLVFQAFRHYEPTNMARSALFHEMVGDAVRQGDAARAGRLMYEHVLQGKDLLAEVVGDAPTVDRLYDAP